MKKIVKGNDFTLLIPVRKIAGGEKVRFPLPASTDVEVNLVNAYRRYGLECSIGVDDDSLIEARVESARLPLGSYALEVKGRLFGMAWRSNEYEQLCIVDNNARGDTSFGETLEGEDSVEMDTAIAVLPPTAELGQLIDDARSAAGKAVSSSAAADTAAQEAAAAAKAASDAADIARSAAASAKKTADDAALTATSTADTAAARADAAAKRADTAAARAEGVSVGVDTETGEIVVKSV